MSIPTLSLPSGVLNAAEHVPVLSSTIPGNPILPDPLTHIPGNPIFTAEPPPAPILGSLFGTGSIDGGG